MSKDVFNRIEKKYLLSQEEYKSLMPKIKEYMTCEEHDQYLIQNIYYDTSDDYLTKHSLSKPYFKEKLRLRAYGQVNLESFVFIELKKKVGGVVNKRRSVIKLLEAYTFIHTMVLPEEKPYHNTLVLKEIQQFLLRYPLEARTYVAYRRSAFKADNLRVTFDHNIITRQDDLRLEYGPRGDQLLKKSYYLMEAKTNQGLPMWLVNGLSRNNIYKRSFSKVGKDYLRRHRNIEERGLICLNPSLVTHQAKQLHY